ncbi:MAG TPA: hypothetical protein PKA27_02965 [Fimbriimonadaceae bacterium]|mgnify:CR=1 FL=1|nr:hypothetical protein [Fimbriimonadaceae bacterium]
MSERRFTEKEASEIVRRAVEAQSRQAKDGSAEGIGEQELRSAAKELGISAEAFDAALGDHDHDPVSDRPGLFGGPFRHENDVILDGRIDDDLWEEIVSDVRKTFGEPGAVEKRGNAYEWVATGGGVLTTRLTLRNVGETSRLSISSQMEGLGFLTYLLGVLPVFIGVAVLAKLNFPYEFLWAIAGLTGIFSAARYLTIRSSRGQKKLINALISRIRGTVSGRLRVEMSRPSTIEQPSTEINQSQTL